MKKNKNVLGILFIAVATLLSMSCLTTTEPAKSGLPDFVLNPPMATDAIYGVGYAKKASPALSMKVAETNARADIAAQIETTIQAAMTDYVQEAGVDGNSQTIEFTESITRQITDTTLSGATPQQRVPMDDGGFWVLMVYSKESLVESFDEVAKSFERNDDAAFAEFKAADALKMLNSQLEDNPTTSTPVE